MAAAVGIGGVVERIEVAPIRADWVILHSDTADYRQGK